MAEVLRTGIEARDLEVVIERPDGSCLTVLVNIVPLRNGAGELIGAMNCFQDMTERKRAQKELEHSLAQLRALAARAPYFHNGSAATLEEAIDFYDTRFHIGLSPQEKADLIAFLNAL